MKLLIHAFVKFALGIALCAGLLFWPAGTWAYPGAWLFLALLFVPMLALGAWLYVKHPSLLEKRLENRQDKPFSRQELAVLLAAMLTEP